MCGDIFITRVVNIFSCKGLAFEIFNTFAFNSIDLPGTFESEIDSLAALDRQRTARGGMVIC